MSQLTAAFITPECRANRGTDGAWEEAVARLRVEYEAVVSAWASEPVEPTLNLLLTMDRPGAGKTRTEEPMSDKNPYRTLHARMSPPGAAWDEGFAAGRAAATETIPREDALQALHEMSTVAGLLRVRRDDRAALIESIAQTERFRGGPCLCSGCVEKRADAEAVVDAVLAALAAADREGNPDA